VGVELVGSTAGAAASSVDIVDRAGRLLGIVTIPAGVDVTDRAGRLVGAVSVPAGVDVTDRAGRLVGVVSGAVDVTDRAGRLVGVVSGAVSVPAGVDVTDRAARALGVVASVTAPVDVSDRAGRLVGAVSVPAGVDVTDRAGRLAGIVDTELPAAVGMNDGSVRVVAPQVSAVHYLYDQAGNVLNLARAAEDNTDAQAPSSNVNKLAAVSRLYAYDQVANAWDRVRANPDGSVQAWRPSLLSVTVAGGANAIATATLPAAAGLFHYITAIHIRRVATALLAGGAVLAVTTTNLGGRSWRTGNQASITVSTWDGAVLVDQAFPFPLRSDVVNTATTIVGPAAGAAVSWHIVVDYFTAP
jgi:hypothetical protein